MAMGKFIAFLSGALKTLLSFEDDKNPKFHRNALAALDLTCGALFLDFQ